MSVSKGPYERFGNFIRGASGATLSLWPDNETARFFIAAANAFWKAAQERKCETCAPWTYSPETSVDAAKEHHRIHGDMDGHTCLLGRCALHYPCPVCHGTGHADPLALAESDVVIVTQEEWEEAQVFCTGCGERAIEEVLT